MKEKTKREGSLTINLPFEDAIKRALKVKPPAEGWAEYERKLKRQRKRQRSKSAA
jgi:hypothetical protein